MRKARCRIRDPDESCEEYELDGGGCNDDTAGSEREPSEWEADHFAESIERYLLSASPSLAEG